MKLVPPDAKTCLVRMVVTRIDRVLKNAIEYDENYTESDAMTFYRSSH